MGNALLVGVSHTRIPLDEPLLIQRQSQQPAAAAGAFVKTVEHKVAEAVDNQVAFVILGPLRDVRMAPHHDIGPSVDHHSRKIALTVVRFRLHLVPPVHERNH